MGAWSPRTGLISPYEFTIALAESAWRNGAPVLLEAPVEAVRHEGGAFRLSTPKGTFAARRVVNSAGLLADEVARLAGIGDYRIFPTAANT